MYVTEALLSARVEDGGRKDGGKGRHRHGRRLMIRTDKEIR